MTFGSQFWDELVVQSYKNILKNKPSSALVHTNLGLAYTRMDKDKKAIRSFLRAVKHDKNHAEAYYHLGSAYQRIGKRTEALRAFGNYNKIMHAKKQKGPVVEQLVMQLKAEKLLKNLESNQ